MTKFDKVRKHLKCAVWVRARDSGYRRCGKQASALTYFYRLVNCKECGQLTGRGSDSWDEVSVPTCDEHCKFFFNGNARGGSFLSL